MKIAGMHWYRVVLAPYREPDRLLTILIRGLRARLQETYGRIPEEICVLSYHLPEGGYELVMSQRAWEIMSSLWPEGNAERISAMYRTHPWNLEVGDERWLNVLEIESAKVR